MARLGINASMTFKPYTAQGSAGTSVSGKGVKDITVKVSSKAVGVESRGYNFVRYLRGQKELPLDFNVEADAPCVAVLSAAYWAAIGSPTENVEVTITDAGGDSITGIFVVTDFGPSSPVAGEEEYSVSMKVSATAETEPEFSAASGT